MLRSRSSPTMPRPQLPANLQAVQDFARGFDDASGRLASGMEARSRIRSLIPVAVQCGITDYNNTQLLQGDLHEGDVLVTGQQN